jgi:hypothetical protein
LEANVFLYYLGNQENHSRRQAEPRTQRSGVRDRRPLTPLHCVGGSVPLAENKD